MGGHPRQPHDEYVAPALHLKSLCVLNACNWVWGALNVSLPCPS